MPKTSDTVTMIPHEIMLARLQQFEQMREFFVQMWLQNPALASNAGARIRALLEPMDTVSNRYAVPPAPTFQTAALTSPP